MKKELEIREAYVPENIEEVKELLSTASLDELREFHSRASAAEVFARTKKNREMYLAAGEVKLWSERRVGEIRRELPERVQPTKFNWEAAKELRRQGLSRGEIAKRFGVNQSAILRAERLGWIPKGQVQSGGRTRSDVDKEFGIGTGIGWRWQQVADIPESHFSLLIQELKKSEGALTVFGILSRDGRHYNKRIEPGIYQARDGRLRLKWQRAGIAREKKLSHSDIAKARKQLAELRGDIKEPVVKVGRTIGDGYSHVRRALQTLDKIETSNFHPDGKKKINQAILYLQRAEDELVGASNLVKVGRPFREPRS